MAQDYDVLIIGGFGHVGLPLGITLADAGLQVRLYDLNTALRPSIEAGTMPFIEYGAEPVLQKVIGKTLHVANDLSEAAGARNIIITIGTPVDEYLSPKTRGLFDLADSLLPHLSGEQCVILRSTVFPGTSEHLTEHVARKGKTIHLAYCPERIVQGYAMQELRTLPQVIAGSSPQARTMATKLFGALGVETIDVDFQEAELTKLFLNAWRYIQFAVGNQFYMMAQERGLNYDNIYRAMTHNYKRGDLPKPGFAAGPCLLKDTMQLSSAYRNGFLLGHAAMMVNEGLPAFVIQQLIEKGVQLSGMRVGILGMAFKAEIDDPRDSLSYKLRKILEFHGATVVCSDEYLQDPSFVSKETIPETCQTIIVGVPHKAYRDLAIPNSVTVMDLWGVLQQ